MDREMDLEFIYYVLRMYGISPRQTAGTAKQAVVMFETRRGSYWRYADMEFEVTQEVVLSCSILLCSAPSATVMVDILTCWVRTTE